jgi:protein phosphatase
MSGPSDRFAALQSKGKRYYQEDDFGFLDDRDSSDSENEHTLLVVADGMGGHAAGAKASQIVTESFIDTYQRSDGSISSRLQTSLQQCNDEIVEASKKSKALKGMGTTLLAAVVSNGGLEWISVGDSPLWLYREGTLRRMNADHSMSPILAEMVEAGEMTEAQAAIDPKRSALRSAVMGRKLSLIDESKNPTVLQRGDRILLATDGILTLSDEQIAKIIENNHAAPNEDSVTSIMHDVNDTYNFNQDNTTILLYSIAFDSNQ